jgi:hypothetical protein
MPKKLFSLFSTLLSKLAISCVDGKEYNRMNKLLSSQFFSLALEAKLMIMSWKVTKRDGRQVPIKYDNIKKRLEALTDGLRVDIDMIIKKTIGELYDGVKTSELDEQAATICASMNVSVNYDWFFDMLTNYQ